MEEKEGTKERQEKEKERDSERSFESAMRRAVNKRAALLPSPENKPSRQLAMEGKGEGEKGK